ncbi:MAG: hypothetical protein FJ318_08135, partial [SAR202 cluster bacterium]|nr:hypothetical protein [SAR202 cluster bacterium]
DSKFGRAPIEYPHEDLREILEETYGIIVYQDQVLHVLRRFAGYSLGSADIVRKAMGKKIADLMAKEREKFVAGALARGYERETAEAIFDLIQPFAGYAFNKAHSVSYAVVAYWTAYFKANYPVEFMTCVLNAYGANSDKASAVIAECKRLDIPVLPPDISRSRVEFAIDETDDGTPAIRFGLASIKNVGESAVEDLVAERERKGAFTSLGDFCRRAGSQVANRRVLESLIKVGALDALAKRGSLLASVETVMRAIQREAQLKDSGQSTMFNLFGQSVATPMADITLVPAPDPSANEAAQWERELLGVAVTARPLDALYRHAPAEAVLSLEQLEHEVPDGANVTLVGQITTVRYVMTKQQQRLAFIVLALPNGSVDVGVRSRALAEAEPLLREGTLVLLTGKSGRGRNEELVVWCDRVQEYRLPADDASAPDPEPTGPRLEEWHEPEPALAVAGASPKPPTNAAPNASNMTTPTQPRPAAPAAGSPRPNGNGYGHGKANGNGNGHAAPSSAAPEPPQRRKVLVRLTETEQPEEDAYLLRAVLSLLLEYPGSDGVDLIISSQGKRYRMEMPIITTSYCPELAARIAELFGRQDAVLVQGPAG